MSDITVLTGDCRDVLRTLPAESVHCAVTSPPYWGLRSYLPADADDKALELGSEPTPEEYVAKMVEVFREVRRVLRDDGTLWLNLGDSYATPKVGNTLPAGFEGERQHQANRVNTDSFRKNCPPGLKPKDLVGIPWRVAFALQADGWWLRSDIIWHKPNPMPESVTDRPTKAHEYLFLLSKSARYYYDADAIREPIAQCTTDDSRNGMPIVRDYEKANEKLPGYRKAAGSYFQHHPDGRNKRSVWTVATQPYSGAHFATFPPKLIEPCILAGTSERGCCPECGAPWQRVVERTGHMNNREAAHVPGNSATKVDSTGWAPTTRPTNEWRPDCLCGQLCGYDPVPCTILDPFAGSGTTGQVAIKHNRRAVLIELNAEYAQLIEDRLNETQRVLL